MHPAWEHVRLLADDPAAALEQRIEVARQSGVPAAALERYRESRDGDEETGIDAIQVPDRELLPGVEVETDLGAWQVHETPGHAPSHVVLHQPESKLMISGDHLLGRTVLFFDYGHTPRPGRRIPRQPRRGRAARRRPLPARPRPPLPRPREQDRRGAPPGRGAARQGPRLARAGRADRLRDRRRVPRPREPRQPGQRLGPADRPLLPRPHGARRRGGRRSRAADPQRWVVDVAFRRWRASPSSARSRRRRRRSSTCSPTTARYADDHAAAQLELEREGEPAPERGRRDPRPQLASGRRCARK